MSDDGVAPGEEHDDSPWRPGAHARFDHLPRQPFDRHPSAADEGERDHPPTTPIRRGVLAALVLAVVIGGAVVAVGSWTGMPSGDVDVAVEDPPTDVDDQRAVAAVDVGGDVALGAEDTPLASAQRCTAHRLPSSVDPLWDVELVAGRRVISPVTIGGGSVVAVVAFAASTASASPSVSVVALDIEDGRERWRADLRSSTGRHEVVGIIDGAVIVRSATGSDMAFRRLFAFDEESGEMLWDRGFRGDWSATADSTTGLVYVGVRRPAVSSTEESEVEVIDPRVGARVHIAAGSPVGLDPDGRQVTRLGDEVLATSPTERHLLGVVDPAESPFALVGSQVVVADGDGAELSVYSGPGDGRTLPLVGSPGIDPPGFIVGLEPNSDSSILVTGAGAVHGAQLGDDGVEIRWRVAGVVVESVVTDRGRSLLVANDGGAQQRVVDSSTGRTVVDLELRPGTFTTLALASNGVVVQDYVDGELLRVALDLDGRELWSLAGSGPFAIGRGMVVDVDDSDAAIRLIASGAAATGDEPAATSTVC
ncbi:PQQ-binding-like beta-propeller repeat protein [Ilumatobacter sp.]|uniref:outer membrane protein assembly factor BamB family protein n=1 Tax=Ilumatobacter sp. TaxID=1967498 RepID=UPI003C574628